jgi:zinc/manganese transport system substrate-binding protein
MVGFPVPAMRPGIADQDQEPDMPLRLLRLLLPSVVVALTLSACGSSSPSSSRATANVSSGAGSSTSGSTAPSGGSSGKSGKFLVVAAENFWGSIATQLAGDKPVVRSIIVNPDTDPHSYNPTASDGQLLAQSKLAIVNGIGYDKWASQSLAASPSSGRIVLDVGDLLGMKEGDNPHRWYFPSNVYRVIDQIASDYDKLDPADASYFAQQKRTFETRGLARYDQLRREIRSKYAGVPVGYSESIFQGLGQDLGLKLLTPYSFAKAIAEGTEVTATDKRTVDSQARNRLIKVWVYNSQNVTPDVAAVTKIVKAQHIPIATVTETLSPASDNFEQWQVAELRGLLAALHRATGH